MDSGIKYRYALNINQEIVDVFALTESDRRDYECVSCSQVLRPVMGEKRQKHFRHQVDVDCSQETYLHRLGKLLFLQTYRQCLATGSPFEIEYLRSRICTACDDRGPCKVEPEPVSYDLTRAFPYIALETPDGAFIPDVLLWNDRGEKLYVEIAVTHFSTEAKCASGVRMIELAVAEEADLELIPQCFLSSRDERVTFLNFRVQALQDDFSEECRRTVSVFILWPSGKSVIRTMPAARFKEDIQGAKPFYFKLVRYTDGRSYVEAVESAYLQGLKVTSCFLCRYSARPNHRQWEQSEEPVFCKFLKKPCRSNDAAECQYYRSDPKVFRVYENGDVQKASTRPQELQPTRALASRLNQAFSKESA